jgi:hypothetical protein
MGCNIEERGWIGELRPEGNPTPNGRPLLLPGALLVAISAELLAPFMFIDFRFSSFL